MIKGLIFGLLGLTVTNGIAQDQKDSVALTLEKFIQGMNNQDTVMLNDVCIPTISLVTTGEKDGNPIYINESFALFKKYLVKSHEGVYEEVILSTEIKIDDNLAFAWAPYLFKVDTNIHHCGVNLFNFVNTTEGWKISGINDSRRKEGCLPVHAEDSIHVLMDNWHKSAAVADEDAFFGAMTKDGIYLGTDPSERWLRDELKHWAKKSFESESAWAFTSHDRHIYFYNEELAWFEELLDTWMGPCRGSGVVEKIDGQWKIKHYDLSIMVKNEDIKTFLDVIVNK